MILPDNYVILGLGGTFQIEGRFMGRISIDGVTWGEEEEVSGKSRFIHYAARINSDVAKLNGYTLPPPEVEATQEPSKSENFPSPEWSDLIGSGGKPQSECSPPFEGSVVEFDKVQPEMTFAEYMEAQENPKLAKKKPKLSSLKEQIGGSHYKEMAMQPVEFCQSNGLGYCESLVIRYVCRHRRKNGAEDIRKAIHSLQLLLQIEYPEK